MYVNSHTPSWLLYFGIDVTLVQCNAAFGKQQHEREVRKRINQIKMSSRHTFYCCNTQFNSLIGSNIEVVHHNQLWIGAIDNDNGDK
jgi:hypothetical protein